MIVGTGVDLTEIKRIKGLIARHGDRFLERIYTSAEITYCQTKLHTAAESFAARFAAKEAGAKAFGTGMANGLSWQELEVIQKPGGQPALVFHGHAAENAAAMGVQRVHLSLSHGLDVAIAFVVLEA